MSLPKYRYWWDSSLGHDKKKSKTEKDLSKVGEKTVLPRRMTSYQSLEGRFTFPPH